MRKRRFRSIALGTSILFLLMSIIRCTSAVNVMPTSTPFIETKAQWRTGLVMAIVLRAGESFYTYFSAPPDAIIYSDGRQIIWHDGNLHEKRLSTQDICQLLEEVDHSGFFAYTSEQYEQFYKSNHMKPGPESFSITIDAWKSNSLQLNSFRFLFSQYKDSVEWPVALRVPYERLTMFDPDSMHQYVPEHVAVHIEKDPDLGTDIETGTWKSTRLSLAELINRYKATATPTSESSEGEIILSGEESKDILEQFNDKPWGGVTIFVLNGERYLITIRALLPFEESGGVTQPIIPDPNIMYSPVSMNCPN